MNLIDIHTHGIGGFDTGSGREEDILSIASLQGKAGIRSIVLTLYPDSIAIMRKNLLAVRKAIEIQAIRKDAEAAMIIGAYLEGPFLNPKKCGALNAASFIEATEYNLMNLLEGFEDIVKIVTISPEIRGAEAIIRKLSELGIIASMGHSVATYIEAEAGFHAGARGITHLFNAMGGYHHREPGLAGFGLLNRDIYVEVIADPYHLHPATLDLIFRTKVPERIILISDSVKETPLRTVDTTGSSTEETGSGIRNGSGRLQGGSDNIAESLQRLIDLGFDRELILRCAAENPSEYLKLKLGGM